MSRKAGGVMDLPAGVMDRPVPRVDSETAGPETAVPDEAERNESLDPDGKKVRVSLDLSRNVDKRLNELAKDLDVTRSDVLRRALALFGRAVEARKEGLRVGAVGKSGRIVKEFVGFDD